MTKIMIAVAAATLLAGPAFADVTVTSQVSGKTGTGETIVYVKGLKMRSDANLGGMQVSTIFDLEAQKFITLNHGKKEAVITPMSELQETMQKATNGGKPTTSLKPNGQTKEVAGLNCTGYDSLISMPMALGNGMDMTIVMMGPVFIAKNAPGSADFAKFYRGAAEKGFVLADPREAKAPGSPGRGMSDLYTAIADTGGIPYYMELSMKVEGGGPMAAIMGKSMSGPMMTSTVTNVATSDIPATTFDVPAGYKVKTK
jgi:hypothetical protein